VKNCPGAGSYGCRDRIPDGWDLCQKCRAARRRVAEGTTPEPSSIPGQPRCGGGHGTATAPPATIRLTYRDRAGKVLATEEVCQRCADAIARPWAKQGPPLLAR